MLSEGTTQAIAYREGRALADVRDFQQFDLRTTIQLENNFAGRRRLARRCREVLENFINAENSDRGQVFVVKQGLLDMTLHYRASNDMIDTLAKNYRHRAEMAGMEHREADFFAQRLRLYATARRSAYMMMEEIITRRGQKN